MSLGPIPHDDDRDVSFDVFSKSKAGQSYKVTRTGGKWECACPHHVHRKALCHHIQVGWQMLSNMLMEENRGTNL